MKNWKRIEFADDGADVRMELTIGIASAMPHAAKSSRAELALVWLGEERAREIIAAYNAAPSLLAMLDRCEAAGSRQLEASKKTLVCLNDCCWTEQGRAAYEADRLLREELATVISEARAALALALGDS